jgi:hypothetical protein
MLELCSLPVPKSSPFRAPDTFFSQVHRFRVFCSCKVYICRSMFDQFKQAYYLSLNKLFDALTDQEVEQLVSLLEKLSLLDAANSC